MENVTEMQDLITELRQENDQLKRQKNFVSYFTYIFFFLVVLSILISTVGVVIFNLIVAIISYFHWRHVNNQVKMNNFMIVLTHSCLQSNYNTNYHPANDKTIQNRDLVN